jgi:diguanylate cyclase (GGDEF)-like protein/PAS domain S-box-containing protein
VRRFWRRFAFGRHNARVLENALAAAEASHRRLREAIEILPQGIVFLDPDGRYILWNQKYSDIYKRSADLFKEGVRLEDTLRIGVERGDYPAAVGREEDWIRERLELLYNPGVQHEQVTSDGRCILIEERRTGDGGIIGLRMDITHIKQREASFRLLFEDNPVPMFVVKRDTHRFLAANVAARAHYGYATGALEGMTLADLSHSGAETPAEILENSVSNCMHRTAAGTPIEVVTFARFLDYEAEPAILLAAIDITERKQAEARVAYMAHHDGLTDLPNRVLFRQRMVEALARRTPAGDLTGVLCIDLDNFKLVNDTLGHPVGDALLEEAATRITGIVRDGDMAARLGGDEFAVLAGMRVPEEVALMAERLIGALSEPYLIEGHVVSVGASIGIAVAPGDGEDSDRLLRNADLALYRAKAEGKGTFRFFEAEMDARAQARRQLELDLRAALASGGLEVHYQPLVTLDSEEITGFEALVRWPHATRGFIPPSEFIALAEETNLIMPLGAFVLQRACADAMAWPGHVRVSVNLSPLQFRLGNVFVLVQEALRASGLDPSRLDLEITEGVFLEETDQVRASLHALRALGVRISLDDFGTGYSSLSYLRSFPFDTLKIDRSFVRGLKDNEQTLAIVRAVLALASGLNMKVVAEGIETEDEIACLKAEGCAKGQGFYFAQARPQREILELFGAEKQRNVA